MKTIYTETAYKSFNEENLGDLADKEGHAVLLGAAEGTVKLPTDAATAAQCIGTIHERYGPNDKEVTIRLFGKGGTLKARAGGIIAKGAEVQVDTDGRFITLAGGTSVGRKLDQGASAVGDFIEVLD